MSGLFEIRFSDLWFIATVLVVCLSYIFFQRIRSRNQGTVTCLQGPPNDESFIFGLTRLIYNSTDPGAIYESWSSTYGSVYQVPAVLGSKQIVLCDAKAISSFFSKDSFGYVRMEGFRQMLERLIGKGLLWAEGESHKRQRKGLTPAFSNATVRRLTPIFFDSAYKMKLSWDSLLESSQTDDVIVEVQGWLNYLSFDAIGLAGFAHDFGALDGKQSPVLSALDSFSSSVPTKLSFALSFLQFFIPFLGKIPTKRAGLFSNLSSTLKIILGDMIVNTRNEKDKLEDEKRTGKSVIEILIESEVKSVDSVLRISQEEVMAQMKVVLIAGYDPPAMMVTWALIELSKRPDLQMKLRKELVQCSDDPTWDQMNSGFPLLEAVVCEVLRLHPHIGEMTRVATEDNVLPLGTPVQTASGEMVDRVSIPKGAYVTIPIHCMNRSAALWGDDAKDFVPERWLNDSMSDKKAKEIQGHKHVLTFGDGPRICLGKAFALAEIKAVLIVLIRHYTFEFPGGLNTKIGSHLSLLPRPKVEGENGSKVPLKIRRAEI